MTEGPIARKRMRRTTQRALILGLSILAGVAVLGVLVYFALGVYLEKSAQARRASQENAIVSLVQELTQRIEPVSRKLDALSRDPRVLAALRGSDAAAREALARALSEEIPGAWRLRLLPPELSQPDPTDTPPLTYASLDMLNRARTSTTPIGMEAHLVGSADEHIVMVRRVESIEGRLLGFIHLSMKPDFIRDALAAMDLGGGYAELREPLLTGEPVVIARRGGAAPPAGVAGAGADVPGTRWKLMYWGVPGAAPSGGGSRQAAGGVPLPAVLGAVVIAVLAALGVMMFRRRRAGAGAGGASVVYQGAVLAIMEGAHPGLERLVPGLEVRERVAAKAPPVIAVDDELEGDDITTFKPSEAISKDDITEPAADMQPAELEIDIPLDDEPAAEPAGQPSAVLPEVIFRTYDIRGIVGETLTGEGVYEIGRALGSEAYERGQQGLVVARDGRLSSPELAQALIKGLRDTGRDVIDIGMVPTPVLYFATHFLETASGVMLTGSHNPPQYNGLKIVLDGETLSGDAIKAIRKRIADGDLTTGAGHLQTVEIVPEYIRRVSEDIPVALGNAFKIVVDCGNGVPGAVAPELLRALGHDVIELYCEVDGNFPNHHPDPSQPDNLRDLIDMVQLENADLGLAFDGDGDRLGVVDQEGTIIWPDRQMMLLARDVLSRNAGAQIIFDVKCSRRLAEVIETAGGSPLMWKTGHSLIKAKMKETGALLAGEMSGHIFFKERWYGFDDALYTAARLLEVLLGAKRPPAEVFAELPGGVATPELRIDLPEDRHAAVMEALIGAAQFEGAETSTIDGLRVDLPDSWGLVRPSNTTPCLVLRFEGNDEAALAAIQERFRALIQGVDENLALPF